MPKPFAPEELVAMLDSAISGRERGAPPPGEGGVEGGLREVREEIRGLRELLGGGGRARASSEAGAAVTPKEAEVLGHLGLGLMNKEIAPRMGVSVRTVERHVTDLMRKSGTGGRTELLRWAIQEGLVEV
ncbi:hypothetical protein TeGR_g6818 [Tetraparma gracilis]|uniref:HTH luxR-type domain-containing protein n=1 Tax=Tetraparma gracilis TaxID=2962635 RepID=A0ABQ6MM21_9STRA|nr:hypothetical protein TeGR_g6818 [Tetraparma gracilis]